MRHNKMYMTDYIKQLDLILSSTGEKVLSNSGTISHEDAIQKVKVEYKKYQVKTLSPVEESYIKSLKELDKKLNDEKNNK